MITLEQWRRRFEVIDTCPWRGPKPMEPGDGDLLIGRADTIERFAYDVLSHQLVILHGESGVGKSSLLSAGLVTDLVDRGYKPIVCREWTRGVGSPDDAESFIASKVAEQLRNLGPTVAAGPAGGVMGRVDAEYGELAVLILDQFEELIRHQPRFFATVLEWVVDINRSYDLHVVISLRSEYVHRLKRLNSAVRAFSMSTFELTPITAEDDIRDVIVSPNALGIAAISPDAVERLITEWVDQRATDRGSVELGLLHLQGTLYSLHARAGGATVEDQHVTAMISDAAAIGDSTITTFDLGLIESVSRKLERCEQACRGPVDGVAVDGDDVLDDVLIQGTRAAICRAAGHLSSGGYKLDREAWDLAELSLARELSVLRVSAPVVESAFRELEMLGTVAARLPTGDDDPPGDAGDRGEPADLLSVPRGRIAADIGLDLRPAMAVSPKLAQLGITVSPWESDPDGLTAGPMLGLRPEEVAIEEMRRFAFALEWLAVASLVRSTSPAPRQTMVSLIHDGFGRALQNWAQTDDSGPADALTQLTSRQGEVFEWMRPDSTAYWPALDGAGGTRVFVNLRWRNSLVRARFRQVVFANCDFRGTRFEGCSFTGVVFVNCLLDGATFGDCDIVGGVTEPTAAYDEDGMPSFVVDDVDAATRTTLARYRDQDVSGPLYSATSGIPVVTRTPESRLLDWKPQRGGLTMYGGRLSSLMIRSGRFRDGGTLALRHVAGSSLDITEQGAARIEIFGSSIRGLSISRTVGQPGDGDIDLSVRGSVVADSWFGDQLTGLASYENSVIWQVMNVSDGRHFVVTVDNCMRWGVTNASGVDPERAGAVAPFGEALVEDRSDLAHQSTLMAYRREPALVELGEAADGATATPSAEQ